MGTTMTVALVEGDHVSIGHVGDSRAYLVRDGRMEQLTDDHSLVNELLKSGRLSPEEAETHPQRSVITRALGTDPNVDVDAFRIDAQAGDLFLICSDGLTSMVDDEDILELLERHGDDLERAARSLVSAANKGGGEDNITVVAFRIAAGGDEAADGDTIRMPAAADPEETTLDAVAPPPAVDTMVIPPDRVDGGADRARLARGGHRAAAGARRPDGAPACRADDARPARDRDRPARLGAAALSLRNRELLNLVAVGALDRRRLRKRLHLPQVGDLGDLADVRGLLLRALPRRARRGALRRPVRRPVPAPPRRRS